MSELHNAKLRWLDSGQPYSEKFSDIYYSKHGGIEESETVFLQANKLKSRWQKLAEHRSVFTLAELGFGTGLNFLLCWRLWQQLQPAKLILHYIAIENFPLTKTDLQRAHRQWPQLDEFSTTLLGLYPDHTSGIHRLCFDKRLVLDIHYGDAATSLRQRHRTSSNKIDCWFMDGFNPKHNSSMWSDELAQLMYQHSSTSATLSTYSVAGTVRRTLSSAGFAVAKKPGVGEKREMLVANKAETPQGNDDILVRNDPRNSKPWFQLAARPSRQRTALVIGAGFAGCSTANSLARRGWHVTLIDRADHIASGASGNKQAILQCRLAADPTAQSRFYLQSFLFAHRQLQQLEKLHRLDWQNCGVLMLLDHSQPRLNHLHENLEQFYDKRVVAYLTQQQASERANIGLNHDALWLPHGGWLDPNLLCAAYLDDNTDNPIQLVTSTVIDSLEQTTVGWRVHSGTTTVASAEVVILANSINAAGFAQTEFLSLIPVRGQVSQFKGTSLTEQLSSVVVSVSTICPAQEGTHCIGATYAAGETDRRPRSSDDEQNLLGINSVFKTGDLGDLEFTDSRAAVRCNTTDYFPIVGAVPDYQRFQQEFSGLRRNAKVKTTQKGSYLPGLYINTGHGSYGLATCPLSAEFLASLIENESLPLPINAMDSLSPARFIIRNLKKQRVGSYSAQRL